MQKSTTHIIRRYAHDILMRNGKLTLSQLANISGLSKDKIRYAIDSTTPFGALFRKYKENGILVL